MNVISLSTQVGYFLYYFFLTSLNRLKLQVLFIYLFILHFKPAVCGLVDVG